MMRSLLVVIVLFSSGLAWGQRALITPDFSSFSGSGGLIAPHISSFVPLPDGGNLVLGRFKVWYEGKEFRDVLKLRPDGLPDTEWQVLANNDIYGAVVLKDSVVLHGRFDYVNGVAARSPIQISLLGAAPLPFERVPNAISTTPGSYEVATGWTYVLSALPTFNYQVNRVNAKTGVVDPTWKFSLPTNVGGAPGAPVADQQGGLWISWVEEDCFNSCFTTKMARFSATEPGRELIARLPTLFQRRPYFADGFAYVGESRYRISDGALDPTWKTYLNFSPTIDRGYLYAWTLTSTTTEVYYALRRAPLSGTGAFDDWTFDLPDSRFIAGENASQIVPYGPVDGPSPVAIFAITRGAGAPRTLIVKDDSITTSEVAVVEYYAPTLKRYFITGRKAEQDALDALPASFTRTGMRFVAKSGRYREFPEQPVCRLYAAPEKGGSNSHFYGVGNDCQTLNKVSGLKYEGFDFSVRKPQFINTLIALCPSEAPQPVWRLFNNKVATNEGNHRYVVSQTTREKMQAQGWVDEGAVFCSASVTDSALVN